jgi:hypothetical protein
MTYTMKDLGYARTPTDAKLRVEMPDGSLWEVPVQVIVDSRDEYYRGDEEDTTGFIRKGSLGEYEVYDWAGNNMNWSDVQEYAVQVPLPVRKVDFEDGWANGEKSIEGAI